MAPPKFLDTYLPYLLQRADHLMSAAFHSSLMGAGVQVSEWRVLAVLSEHESLSVQEVANVALLPQPTASHACRRLEDSGLLTRRENDTDRRRKMLALSDDGRDLVVDLKEQARVGEARALERLSVDSAELAELLRSVIVELEAGE